VVVEFRILGALAVVEGSEQLDVGAAKQRALLALLLLHRNEEMPSERIIDLLWAGRPPATAAKSLQVYVSGLRRALGEGRLETIGRAYRLRVEPGELDLDRFEQLVERARTQDPTQAAGLYQEALALFQGEPLLELRYEEFAQAEIARLDELRVQTQEDMMDAELARGDGRVALLELEALVASHPLRERLRGQLMLALYRSGRQADALAAYREGWELLDERLGLEPGPALKELERQILEQDPALAPRAGPLLGRRRAVDRRRLAIALVGGALVVGAAAAAAVVELTGAASRVVSGNTVVAIGTSSGRTRSYTDVGTTPGSIAVGDGAVWVLNGDDRTISRIDPRTRRVEKTFATGTTPTELAVGDGALWIGNGSATSGQASFEYTASLSRVDPQSTQSTRTVRLAGQPFSGLGVEPGFDAIAVAQDSVWAINPDRSVSRLDAATGALRASIPAKAGIAIAADRRGAWFLTRLASGEPAVARIDARTDRVAQTIPIAATGLVDLTVGAGSVWATDPFDGTVWRIDGGAHPVTRTIQADFGVSHVAFGDGAVWVANFLRGTVSRIDPRSNAVTATLSLPGTPQGIAVGEGSAWVSLAGGTTTGKLPSANCSAVVSGGAKPDVLIASDLPLQGPATVRLLPTAIEVVLRLHHFRAGRYAVGYQSCDDSTAQSGSFDFFKCAANARAFAEDQRVVAVIGPYDSGCAQAEIPILNRAPTGSLALLSPSNTLPGLTRTSAMNGGGEPGRYYPTGTRNFLRVSAADDLDGAADAALGRQLHLKRVYVLSDGSLYGNAVAAQAVRIAKRLGLTIAGSARWNQNARDDSRLAGAIAQSNAQGALLGGFFFDSGPLIKALRARSGPRLVLIGTDGYLPIPELLKTAGPAAIGMYVADSLTMNSALGQAGQRFLHALEAARHGAAPPSGAYLPETAQLTELTLDAIARSNGKRASVLQALRGAHVTDGLLGSFSFDRNGDKTPATFAIVRVAGAQGTRGLATDFRGSTFIRVIRLPADLVNP
jgi:DNA-binding SARP family transcriptional activator/ABC-type branched-subunit amino acid transport system substrate-binding protein/DNA-binding beta-propeller fold protein YncE